MHYYLKKLLTLKYVEGTVMADHITRVLYLHNKIVASGLNLDDSIVTHTPYILT